jgi:hypothetical protein
MEKVAKIFLLHFNWMANYFFLSNCIGVINRTHVCVCVSQENQIPFIGRKCVPTQNIMATCSLDMQFTFVWAEWEGSAHDTRIFLEAIDNPNIRFLKPPEGIEK